jgi:hypothetical protein
MCRVFSMLCPSYKLEYHSCLSCVSVLFGGYWSKHVDGLLVRDVNCLYFMCVASSLLIFFDVE